MCHCDRVHAVEFGFLSLPWGMHSLSGFKVAQLLWHCSHEEWPNTVRPMALVLGRPHVEHISMRFNSLVCQLSCGSKLMGTSMFESQQSTWQSANLRRVHSVQAPVAPEMSRVFCRKACVSCW